MADHKDDSPTYEEYDLLVVQDDGNISDDGSDDASNSNIGFKAPPGKRTKMSGYNKRQILNHLKMHGCNIASFKKATSSFKLSRNSALETFNEDVKAAQDNVHQECKSKTFTNVVKWLDIMKKWNLPEISSSEHAVVINAVAHNEEHPEPNELNGVDLKSIYQFLGNGLLGFPQSELNLETKNFLCSEMEAMFTEANSELAYADTMHMKDQLENNSTAKSKPLKTKLCVDPLLLNSDLKFNF